MTHCWPPRSMSRSAPIAGTATLMAVTYAIDEPEDGGGERESATSLLTEPVATREGEARLQLPHRRQRGAAAPEHVRPPALVSVRSMESGAGGEHDVRRCACRREESIRSNDSVL